MLSLEDLSRANRIQLLTGWEELFKAKPPRHIGLTLLRRILACEFQARQYGRLDRATKQAIRTGQSRLYSEKPFLKHSPRLKAGSRLMREWNGVTHQVEVLEKGYLWQGKACSSLSAIARAITGAHQSGPRFFGLNKHKKELLKKGKITHE